VPRRSPRALALTALQYTVAVAALAWVVLQVEPGAVLARLGRLGLPVLAALLAVTLVGLAARFYTWQAVLAPVHPVDFRTAASTDLIVNFVNQLLPSRLSGRVAAPFVLRSQTGMAYADAAAVSGVHTGVYAVYYGLTAAAGLALAVALNAFSTGLVLVLALSTGLYLAAGAVVLLAGTNLDLLDPLVGWLAGAVSRLPRVGDRAAERVRGLLSFTEASTDAFRKLAADPGLWVRYALGWTVALVVAPGLRVLLLFGALGVAFEPAALLPLYLVTAYSVTLLPLTPGGVGVTEATATAVFVALGVPSGVVVPVVVIDRSLGVYLPAVAGWYPSLGIDLSDLSPGQ
jgi:uncharacterized protein (TIRG00374 family)